MTQGNEGGKVQDLARLELRFKGMLARIFSDGVVTDEERAELRKALDSGILPTDRVNAVVDDFLKKSFLHFAADGTFTDSEKNKLRLIVSELGLAEASLPEDIRRVLGG